MQIEILRQLCQVYGHTWLDGQHISYRCAITNHHPCNQWFPSFLTPQEIPVWSTSAFLEWQRGRDECQSGSNPRRQTSTTQGYKSLSHSMTNISVPEVNMLKNSSTLAVSVPINLSIKLGFVSVNGQRETYFVDTLHTLFGILLYSLQSIQRKNKVTVNKTTWFRPHHALNSSCAVSTAHKIIPY